MYAPNFAPTMTLRDYQQYAVDSLYNYFEHNTGNPVIAMPTGTGKSLVIAGFIKGLFERWPTQRVMMLTHVKELIEQNADKLEALWPSAPVGIFSAGLKSKEAKYPITFAGIQSCAKVAAMFNKIDIIIIDECHLVSPNQNTSYQKFIADLKVLNPMLKVVGLSATPYRLGLGMITDGGIFTDVCCDMTTMEGFNWFIDQGYLSPLIPMPTETQIDLTGVGKRGGEFIEGALQKAVDKDSITEAALNETIAAAHDRERILVFATGVDHTIHIVEMLHLLGETAACVHSKMTPAERRKALADHKSGAIRWLVNNNVLTTGYDDPALDCIVMLRPTSSPGLWVQMLGRGTRPLYSYNGEGQPPTAYERLEAIAASPKQNCLVLDFAGNTMRLGPVNDPMIPKKKKALGGEPPVKYCEKVKMHQVRPDPDRVSVAQLQEFHERYDQDHKGGYAVGGCGAYNHTVARNCCQCGAAFIFTPNITTTASHTELIKKKNTPQVETFRVEKVIYDVHEKTGGTASMKVTYHCGMRRFKEWVPAWHTSGVRHKGESWWKERTDVPLPDSPKEAVALSDNLVVPTHIRVWLNKKYPEVMASLFERELQDE